MMKLWDRVLKIALINTFKKLDDKMEKFSNILETENDSMEIIKL